MQATTTAKRITLATLKSFIRRNHGQMYLMTKSHFDGMTDGTTFIDRPTLTPAVHTDKNMQYTLGLAAAWFVGCGRDYFQAYEDAQYVGYEVSNCCVNFLLVIEKSPCT